MYARTLLLTLIGLAFYSAMTFADSSGDFRDQNINQLRDLVLEKVNNVEDLTRTQQNLLLEIEEAATGPASVKVKLLRGEIDSLSYSVDLLPVSGPGISISMQDAIRNPGEPLPPGAVPDDLIVHEQDVLAAINAMWRGGAEAVTVMGVRVGPTTTVLCVGNTLLIENQVFSPPFVIKGIGDQTRLLNAIRNEEGLRLYRQYVQLYKLGYQVTKEATIDAPAYTGSVDVIRSKITR